MTPAFVEWAASVGIEWTLESGVEMQWVGNIYDLSRPLREPKLQAVRARPDQLEFTHGQRRAVVGVWFDDMALWIADQDENREIRVLNYDNDESREKLRAYLVEGRLVA